MSALQEGAPLTTTLPGYVYLEYNDDLNIQALVRSQTDYQQSYLDAFNALKLPIYTAVNETDVTVVVDSQGDIDSAPINVFAINGGGVATFNIALAQGLLDWIGVNIYGIARPTFSHIISSTTTGGPYNTFPYNRYPYNAFNVARIFSYSTATNDQYQRVLTWNVYKGDGWQFSIPWLKRRVLRFLTGTNGTDPGISQTYLVSVQQAAGNTVKIGVDSSLGAMAAILGSAIAGGFLALPFQYRFSVMVT